MVPSRPCCITPFSKETQGNPSTGSSRPRGPAPLSKEKKCKSKHGAIETTCVTALSKGKRGQGKLRAIGTTWACRYPHPSLSIYTGIEWLGTWHAARGPAQWLQAASFSSLGKPFGSRCAGTRPQKNCITPVGFFICAVISLFRFFHFCLLS